MIVIIAVIIIINFARWGLFSKLIISYNFYVTTNHPSLALFRWFTVHNSFVYNVRLLFSKDTIGPIPPAVLLLSDGGHNENLAILPLLQRKLERIVVVDGGYKEEEEDYGDCILNALMLARDELNCSFYDEDGKDVITDLMQMFVKGKGKPRYYKYASPT